jgi:alpha-L-arabinofuranosidase
VRSCVRAGPFEFIDMCSAAGIVPVMTTTGVCDQCTAQAMGDLIDYCHGGADTTWGKRRIADGHPAPYNVTWFELGNEQYNPLYPEQVRAAPHVGRTS